jgi:hypothetical protein
MDVPVQNLSQVDHNEGIIVGSVVVSGPKPLFGTRPRSWLIVKNANEIWNPSGEEYSLETVWEEEKIFVTKMPAGDYYITEHRFGDTHHYIDQGFTVRPGQTVYIGRLFIMYRGRHFMHGEGAMILSFRVYDAKELTLARAEKTYGSLVPNVVTDLMGKIKPPLSFKEVHYKTKGRLSWLTGPLTIDKDAVEFRSKKVRLTVPYDSILDVQFEEPWIAPGVWVTIRFSGDGSEQVASFMDLGGRTDDTKRIYRVLMMAYEDYKTSKGK